MSLQAPTGFYCEERRDLVLCGCPQLTWLRLDYGLDEDISLDLHFPSLESVEMRGNSLMYSRFICPKLVNCRVQESQYLEVDHDITSQVRSFSVEVSFGSTLACNT